MIKLNYGSEMPPPQLQGRLDPHLWADFMGQVRAVADRHPYLAKPGGKDYSNWILAGLMGKACPAQAKASKCIKQTCVQHVQMHRKGLKQAWVVPVFQDSRF